jgi:hypothetical protein
MCVLRLTPVTGQLRSHLRQNRQASLAENIGSVNASQRLLLFTTVRIR